MGTLWRSCAKVPEAMEMSFGVVSGVVPGIGVLDMVQIHEREGEIWKGILIHWGFLVHWFEK